MDAIDAANRQTRSVDAPSITEATDAPAAVTRLRRSDEVLLPTEGATEIDAENGLHQSVYDNHSNINGNSSSDSSSSISKPITGVRRQRTQFP